MSDTVAPRNLFPEDFHRPVLMSGDKQVGPSSPKDRITVRLEGRLPELVREMIRDHKAKNLSQFVQGLILLQAREDGRSIEGIDVPGWITARLLRARGPEQVKSRAVGPKESAVRR